MVPKGNNDKSPEVSSARHGGRVVLSLDVEPHIRDSLRQRAAAAGVSMAEYLANALAEPERSYITNAVDIAQPLTRISYHLAQVVDALACSDLAAAKANLETAKRIVAEAMMPLRRRHAEEVRANEPRRGGGWAG
jgi:predicted nicotinamide N-methyase